LKQTRRWEVAGVKKKNTRLTAFFSLLDRWDRAEGAVSVV